MLVVLFIIHHIFTALAMQAETLSSFLTGTDDSEFPLENVPFGVASHKQNHNNKFTATRIGTHTLNQAIG